MLIRSYNSVSDPLNGYSVFFLNDISANLKMSSLFSYGIVHCQFFSDRIWSDMDSYNCKPGLFGHVAPNS